MQCDRPKNERLLIYLPQSKQSIGCFFVLVFCHAMTPRRTRRKRGNSTNYQIPENFVYKYRRYHQSSSSHLLYSINFCFNIHRNFDPFSTTSTTKLKTINQITISAENVQPSVHTSWELQVGRYRPDPSTHLLCK